jgi:hypothetical protein
MVRLGIPFSTVAFDEVDGIEPATPLEPRAPRLLALFCAAEESLERLVQPTQCH